MINKVNGIHFLAKEELFTLEHMPPEKLVEDVLAKERRIVDIMGEIKAVLRTE